MCLGREIELFQELEVGAFMCLGEHVRVGAAEESTDACSGRGHTVEFEPVG